MTWTARLGVSCGGCSRLKIGAREGPVESYEGLRSRLVPTFTTRGPNRLRNSPIKTRSEEFIETVASSSIMQVRTTMADEREPLDVIDAV